MGEKPLILIIDDDFDLVDTVTLVLKKMGLFVAAAYGGREGIERARKERPDLIVLDIMMPDMDGYAVSMELRSDPELSKIPIIMLTSVSDYVIATDVKKAKGRAIVADDFFEKPVDPEALAERIHELLEERGIE